MMNNNFLSTPALVKQNMIERLRKASTAFHLSQPLLDQFLNADPVEFLTHVHSVPSVQVENYHLVLSDETLNELVEMTIRNPHYNQFFCYTCSYFDELHHFIALVHLGVQFHQSKIDLIIRTNFLISVRIWFIKCFWHEDYQMQTLYYISWIPEEVFTDILELILTNDENKKK